jgi:hypothetical protein
MLLAALVHAIRLTILGVLTSVPVIKASILSRHLHNHYIDMSLFALPPELLELIFKSIDNAGDLARFARTSKRSTALAEHHLYRNIHLTSFEQTGLFLSGVKHKHRARHVREFSLDVYDSRMRITDWAVRRLADHNVTKDAYLRGRNFGASFLSFFPKIETLRIHAHEWSPNAIRAELDKIATHGTFSALRSCKYPAPQLTCMS